LTPSLLFHLSSRIRRHPISTLFPYTTLFRSRGHHGHAHLDGDVGGVRLVPVRAAVRRCRSSRDDSRVRVHAGAQWRYREHLPRRDRKSTRLNSSHVSISYAVFCLKKKIIIYY